MKTLLIVPVLTATALAACIPSAFAFEAVNNNSFDPTLSTKLSDPDDIVQNMSQQYTGNSATILHVGNTTVGIIGSNGGYTNPDSPLSADQPGAYVPSQRRW